MSFDIVTAFLCFLLILYLSETKVQKGTISSTSDWLFVSKFCFNNEGPSILGTLNWTIESDRNTLLLLYDDETFSWPSFYPERDSLSCEQKVNMSKRSIVINDASPGFEEFNDTRRPHFWFIAVSQCESGNLQLDYDLTFLNPGGPWIRQFSYDEQGLVGMYLFFWLIFLLELVVHLTGVWKMIQTKNYHPIVRLLTVALALETASLFVSFIHYAIYASNGIGSPGLLGLGDILDITSQLVFMLLLILIAKGWTITRQEITNKRLLLISISLLMICYLILITWQNVGMDPADTIYIYETIPAIILLVLRVIILGWFLWCLRDSYMTEIHSKKKKFYVIFGIIYVVWFLMLPFIALVAIGIPAWNRYRVVQGMYLSMNLLGFSALCYLLWPSKIAEFFAVEKPDFLEGSDPLLGGKRSSTSTHTSAPYDNL